MKDLMDWLRARGISDGTIRALGIRAVEHDQIGLAVAFPYRRGGKTYAAKFRKPEPKDWRSTKGVSRGLFNEDALDRDFGLPIVLTEGEIDTASVIEAGHVRTVSLPDGWTEDGGKREVLLEYEDRLRRSPFVVVAGDMDRAGQSLPKVMASILRGHDVREVRWPDGCKDANDVLNQHSADVLRECIESARRLDPPGGFITSFSDLPALSERRVLRTGMLPFDGVVALELSAMSVWTGQPGHGKSTFLTWVAEKVSLHENIRVGICAFETHPHTLRDQLSRIRTGKPWRSLDSTTRSRLTENLDARFRIVHRTFGDTAHRIAWLEDMIYQLAVRDGCKLIIVDPWNELEHMPEPGESMTAYINWALQHIRQIAEHLEIHIALVAHPKKLEGNHAPGGYDIADSAAFFNKPSLGLTVHQRQDDDGEWVQVTCWKARNARLYGFKRGANIGLAFDPERESYMKRPAKASETPSEGAQGGSG